MITDDEVIEAIRKYGSHRKAAEALGVNRSTIDRRRCVMAMKGWSPEHDMTHTVPDGFRVKGTSTLYNDEGKPVAQWVKSTADLQRQRAMVEAAIDELSKSIKGKSRILKPPKRVEGEMASAYVLGDPHIGLYAWAEECGDDFDTKIAARDLVAASQIAVGEAPPARAGYLVSVGDTLHADDRSNATPAHKNLLDVDTRYQRVIRIAVATLVQSVEIMLTKHIEVKVFMVPGNHDPDSAGWLALALAAYYHNNPRVRVEQSPDPFLYQRFGSNLIGMTHGDRAKMAQLPAIMAARRSKDWGETRYRMIWTGHIHHERVQEHPGCIVESFNTLAASDAWNHAQGYESRRQTQRIDIHAEYGPQTRRIIGIEEVKGRCHG